jgi:hypothetical protein
MAFMSFISFILSLGVFVLILLFLSAIFWMFMFIDALKRRDILWIVLFIFCFFTGFLSGVIAIIYFFVVYKAKANTILKLAGISAIINIFILIPSFIFGALIVSPENNPFVQAVTLTLLLIGIIAGLIILYGYFKLAKTLKLKFLRIMVIISFAFVIILSLLDLALIFMMSGAIITALSFAFLLFSLVELIFGIGVLKLKEKFKGIAIALGIAYLIYGAIKLVQGAFFTSDIISTLSLIIGIAISILEAVLFFRAAKSFQDIIGKTEPIKKIISKNAKKRLIS